MRIVMRLISLITISLINSLMVLSILILLHINIFLTFFMFGVLLYLVVMPKTYAYFCKPKNHNNINLTPFNRSFGLMLLIVICSLILLMGLSPDAPVMYGLITLLSGIVSVYYLYHYKYNSSTNKTT